MAVQKIDYENKIGLQNDENVPNKNKVTDNDMNEIKSKVNNNADELSTAQQNIEDLQAGQGTASGDIASLKNRVTTLEGDNTKNKQDIANKVDKVEGKGLSTEDFTTQLKTKLEGLENYNDTEIRNRIETLETDNTSNKANITTLQNKVTTLEGDNTKNKQDIANKVDKVDGKGLSTEDFTTAEKQKLAGLNNYNDAEIKQDISDIKEEQQTQNNNIKNLQKNDAQQDKSIEALQKENTELKEECSRLRQDLNAFPSGTAEGEYITLKDSADSRFNMFRVGGNSKQETRSGKNLCDNNFKNYTIDNYGYKKIIDSEENLIASLVDKDTSVDLTGIYFGFTHTGKDAIEGMVWLINNGVETANKTNQGIHQYISFYPANEETFNKIFARYDIQVEKGTTATDYEPYGASPSSEFPSEIINVGDLSLIHI